MGGVVLRCTAKMLSLLGTRPRDLEDIEPSDQDWYANLLWLEERKCLILAHAESLSLDCLGTLDSHSIALAKTESRTVLGYMNELARFCVYAVGDAGGMARCDARELNRELRRELHLSRRPPGYFVPIELAGGSRAQPQLRIVD